MVVRRRLGLLLLTLAATISIEWGNYVSAVASTSRPSQFCTAIKPAVQAGQRLPSILADTKLRTLATTKSKLLTEIDTVLNSLNSVRVQLRSAPAKVRSSFELDVLAEGEFKTALGHATTERQIRAAGRELVGSHAAAVPVVAYILSKCESSATASIPAIP